MKALVVYDSVYGNTEKVAQAIASALAAQGEVQTLRVAEATPQRLTGADLLIVGAPTHGSKPTPAAKAWLKGLAPNSLRGVRIAAFDTRVAAADTGSRLAAAFIKLFGNAAEPIAKELGKRGGTSLIAPEGFLVNGTEGPLKEGELERAADWGRQILGKV